MTDRKTEEGLLTENDFMLSTGLYPRSLKKYKENGFIQPVKCADGVERYTKESADLAIAISRCHKGRSADLHEAYEMALEAISSKKRRNERASKSSQVDSSQLKTIDPKKIRKHPEFEDAIEIDAKMLEIIRTDIALRGYFSSQPVVLGIWDGQDEPVLIDGHTRVRASIAEDIPEIPFVIEDFEDKQEAIEFVISVQNKRRRTEDRHILRFLRKYDKPMKRGGDRRSEAAKSKARDLGIETGRSKSANRIATMFGTNTNKVENGRKILKDGSTEIIDDVENGKMTINRAHNLIVKKPQEKGKTKDGSDLAKRKAAKVLLNKKNLAALITLEGSLEDHVNTAVEQYMARLREMEAAEEQQDSDVDDQKPSITQ